MRAAASTDREGGEVFIGGYSKYPLGWTLLYNIPELCNRYRGRETARKRRPVISGEGAEQGPRRPHAAAWPTTGVPSKKSMHSRMPFEHRPCGMEPHRRPFYPTTYRIVVLPYPLV